MADYAIDINVNMGSGGAGNFQALIDATNNLSANFNKIGTAGDEAAKKNKQSFADSMGIIAQYGNSVKRVDKEISDLKKSIIEQNEALKKGTITEAQHKASVDALHGSLKKLQTAQRQYNQLLGQTATHAKNATTAMTQFTSVFNKLGAVMGVSFGLYGVFRVLQSIVKTISEFDLAQKKLRSILGETAEGMKEITESAIQLGRQSIFGAKGVSELQIELAKMGFTKTEIIAMQRAINDLAIATQEDLASSAEVVANILKVYGMTATETRDVVNVMGKAFNDSALGLSNFREAIKYVAPVAKQAGLDFRETVAAMELLANAGLKGSLTGTALNNVLKAMMDSNSKLAKSMGGAVTGWDGFVSVLQRAREKGMDVQDVFGLITQRATGAFSVLMEGLPTLDEMNRALEDVSGVMRDQMLVQLDSIAYAAKITREEWNALVLDVDDGGSVLSEAIKFSLDMLRRGMFLLRHDTEQISKEITDTFADATASKNLTNISEALREDLKNSLIDLNNLATKWNQAGKAEQSGMLKTLNMRLSAAEELVNQAIVSEAAKRTELLKIQGDSYKDFEANRNTALIMLSLNQQKLNEESIEYRIIAEQIAKIDKMRWKDSSANADDASKAGKDKLKYEIDILKLQQQLAEERIKTIEDDFMRETLLAENSFKFKELILQKELELAISNGDRKVDAEKLYATKSELLAKEHANKLIEIGDKAIKASDDLVDDIMKTNEKSVADSVSETLKLILEQIDEELKKNQFMDKWGKDNPILNALFGKGLRKDLLAGLIDQDQIGRFTEGVEVAMDKTGEFLNDYVDSWVEATDRIVDQLNRQVDETQAALDTEIELMKAGYASNVTLKRQELEDIKKAREEALEDQKKAQQAQVAMETITQISSLITASAQIIEGFSSIPIIGTGLGIAAVALMLGAFTAAKAKAMQTAGVAKYEYGGWIGGRRHSEGGTIIEGEVGEFMVNRKSAMKHKDLIEAVNKDDQITLNRIFMNGLQHRIEKSRDIDDSKYLKGIYERLDSSGKKVEYSNGYKIEKWGNVTTRIKMNLN